MHSFHHSRGRIVFEVLCALTVSASCAGAWIQTGASAFLPAAAAAALYAIVHAFDLATARPALAAPTLSVETPADDFEQIPHKETLAPPVEEAGSAEPVSAARLIEPAAEEKRKPRRAKARRKAKGPAKAAVTELEPVEVSIAASVPDMDSSDADSAPVPIAPLFEPEPFVRQQRTVFGRKAGQAWRAGSGPAQAR